MKRGAAILGMGRSGTSMTANAFAAAGYFPGDQQDLIPADSLNRRGYYENRGIVEANDRLLRSLGRYWFAPPTADELAHAHLPMLQDVTRAWDLLLVEASGMPVVVKDPRIGILLPVWHDIISANLEVVLVVRHPVEVAWSVRPGAQVPVQCALAAWELHMKLLLRAFGGQTVTVLPYRHVLERPQLSVEIVQAVTSRLLPEQQRIVDSRAAEQAVDDSLRHNRAPADGERSALTRTQENLWTFLGGLPAGTQLLSSYTDVDDESATEIVQYWAHSNDMIEQLS